MFRNSTTVNIVPLLLAAALLSGLSAGCRMINKGITESVLEGGRAGQWHVRYGSRSLYTLTNSSLEEVEFEGSAEAENVQVRYQRGLRTQAECIAERASGLLGQVEERIGLTISTRSTVHLLRFDENPQSFDIRLKVEPNEFPLPLFVRAGAESCESILARNRSYPYLFVHELVETSLGSGEAGARVLPDLTWGALLFRAHVNNYTRWFRDGLANYAGYVAHQIACEDRAGSEHQRFRETLLHTRPFSSLSEVRNRLFSWTQSPRMANERTYYNAALGLFLLIEETYGEQAVRDIIAALAQRDAVDGRDLLEITDETLGTSIKELVRGFEFPETGLELERMTPALALNNGLDVEEGLLVESVDANSIGDAAGFREKDVIIGVNSTAVANPLDFELGLFKAREQPSVPLTIHRKGAGTLTMELPLRGPHPSEEQGTPPGKRRNPLKKGRIEIFGLFPSRLF